MIASPFLPAEWRIRPFSQTGSGSDPAENPDPDQNLQKNRIQIRPCRKTGSGSEPSKKSEADPNLTDKLNSNPKLQKNRNLIRPFDADPNLRKKTDTEPNLLFSANQNKPRYFLTIFF